MLHYKRASKLKELKQILQLQNANLPTVISSEEKEVEGFVTVQHDLKLLQKMNDACAHIIAKDGELVVGYALCMHPLFGNEIEVLQPMFKEIKKHTATIGPYIVMGQICIHKQYRKQGIFRSLYKEMKAGIAPAFTTIITEVDAINIRSLEAHKAIGFKELSTYSTDERIWELIFLT